MKIGKRQSRENDDKDRKEIVERNYDIDRLERETGNDRKMSENNKES